VTGLNPGTTYYFVINTRTNPHNNNSNTVISKYSEETSATTYPVGLSFTLTVQSTHGSGANITVTPDDINGNGDGATTFKRTYNSGTEVTLTAVSEHKGKKFSHWKVDGIKKTNSLTVQVTMDSDHKAKAYYVAPSRPGLVLSRGKINFGCMIDGDLPPSQALRVTINGDPVDWTTAADVTWLHLSPTSGTGTTELAVSVEPTGLSTGTYKGTITVTAPEADNSPQRAKVTLTIYKSNATTEPIGVFSTPTDGSVVCSSIPVTGWVIDDIGVESVKIYRGDFKDLVYIGDAVFVEGARPDVEEAYPDYPKNYQAGWGYMMLTNFLPNGGNGTFKIHAIATDTEGNSVILGTKTILCDNANAVKPFGAIDTPTQGGTATGSNFINWGWVLTPQPNSIPTDGSTINVFVDGVNIGHPTYNIYRADITNLFPGYANSNGAVGYFYLDTTPYTNGVHTIQWTATDDAGNNDGIGSGYFLIQNDSHSAQCTAHSVPNQTIDIDISKIPVDYSEPLRMKKGYNQDVRPETRYPDENGHITIKIKELERIAIYLSEGTRGPAPLLEYTGFQVRGHQLRLLPAGSTLDTETGVFCWQPGPAFLGQYQLVFIENGPNGEMLRKNINIKIVPKY
jgi:hypothetical protein